MPKPRKLWFQNIVDKNFSGTIASILFITRCAGLIFGNMMIMQCVGVVGMLAQIVGVPILASVATATAVLLGAVGFQLSRTPGAGMGARGSRGDGKPELSLEALRDLMAEPDDGGGSSYADPNFRFLEVSVQETLDNKLIMLHHLDEKNLKRAFPRKGANIEVFEELERDLATNVEKLTAGELTAAQLQSLNYYGQDRVRVATLEEYLAECQKVGMQKPLAIELRHVYSDKARAALVRIVSTYSQVTCATQVPHTC